MKQPIEPFTWGRRQFDPEELVADDDPCVLKFPELFRDGATGEIGVLPAKPVAKKRGPGRPRKNPDSQ